MSEEMKTYIVKHEDGTERKITVPESWKVTFGPAVKGNHGNKYEKFKMPMCLRFYESDTKQRAIFTDVVSFRDSSISIEEKKTSIQEKDGFVECDGIKKRTTFQAKTTEWVDPDKECESTPMLPEDATIFDLDKK